LTRGTGAAGPRANQRQHHPLHRDTISPRGALPEPSRRQHSESDTFTQGRACHKAIPVPAVLKHHGLEAGHRRAGTPHAPGADAWKRASAGLITRVQKRPTSRVGKSDATPLTLPLNRDTQIQPGPQMAATAGYTPRTVAARPMHNRQPPVGNGSRQTKPADGGQPRPCAAAPTANGQQGAHTPWTGESRPPRPSGHTRKTGASPKRDHPPRREREPEPSCEQLGRRATVQQPRHMRQRRRRALWPRAPGPKPTIPS